MDKISIIVPVWNAHDYLNRCLDSIIGQTYENLEIILVDDGSEDDSLSICREYAERDIRIKVFHKENGGQGSARNMGLSYATGDYIGFVDNDDWVLPDMYRRLHEIIIAHDADVARCEDMFDSKEEPVDQSVVTFTENEEFFGLLYQDIWGGHVTDRLFKSNVIGDRRFPHSKTIEDMRFMRLLLPFIKREAATNEKLYFYTIREDNTSFKYARNHISSYERAAEYQDRYLEAKVRYPQYCETLLLKATSFACGTMRMMMKGKQKNSEAYVQMKKFLVSNRKEIIHHKKIGIKYKLFVACLRGGNLD